MKDTRDHHNHPNDVFDAIIVNCSLKNYDRSYNGGNGKSTMYYCEECESMHHEWSRIGRMHKRIP